MPPSVFLPDPTFPDRQRVSIEGDKVTLFVQVKVADGTCPKCRGPATRVYSRYTRTLADLPWQGRAARLIVLVRRFFFIAAGCPQKTFAERLPEVAAPYARSVARLNAIQLLIAQALGGEAGARLALPLGMPTSPDTLLRRAKSSPRLPPSSVRILGVDDWAWKQGQRYGTILREALARAVDRHHAQVAKVAAEVAAAQPADAPPANDSGASPPARPARKSESLAVELGRNQRARRLARFEEVLGLARRGVPLRAIARQLGMSRHTVRLWARTDSFPERAMRRSSSQVDPYVDFLKRRRDEGCRRATRLTEELRALRFTGYYVLIQRRVRPWREGDGTAATPRPKASDSPASFLETGVMAVAQRRIRA